MLLPLLISRTLQPIWASADGRAMLRIYAAQVGVLVSVSLALRFLVLV
jgi:hypothetical protein